MYRNCVKRVAALKKDGTGYASRRAKSSENYVVWDPAEEISRHRHRQAPDSTHHNGDCGLILRIRDVRILLHSTESCIGNVGSIQDIENEKAQKGQNQVQVYLSKH